MVRSLLLRQVRVLEGPDLPLRRADVRIEAGRLPELLPSGGGGGNAADPAAAASEELTVEAGRCLLAPSLVDPHSLLEDPWPGPAETLGSLATAAAAGGYGTVALLPWASPWRDRPERLDLRWPAPMQLLCWGSFSRDGDDLDLAAHGDQLDAGAVGLAAGEALPPPVLLERALRLGEMEDRPLLVAPRDAGVAPHGFVRERVEALRAGWPTDPAISEVLPLQTLLTLAAEHPGRALRLMNLSTREAVDLLGRCPRPPQASVSWWHLVADSGSLAPDEEGWRVLPPLGGPADRGALIDALAAGLLGAVAVHHRPLDQEERLLPLDQRRPGVAGHGLALTLLWQELVVGRGWPPERLWQVLCWGPARFLDLPPPRLVGGGRDWVLFDPEHVWRWERASCPSRAANQPCWGRALHGRVVASGLLDPALWPLTAGRPR
jgi:dihydroorotase